MLLKPNTDKFNEKLFSRSRVRNSSQKNRKCWRCKRKYYTSKTPKADSINSKNIYFTVCAFFMCVILFQLHNIPALIMWLLWRYYETGTRSMPFFTMPIFINMVIFILWQLVYCVCMPATSVFILFQSHRHVYFTTSQLSLVICLLINEDANIKIFSSSISHYHE
jgi:hypothetical protein